MIPFRLKSWQLILIALSLLATQSILSSPIASQKSAHLKLQKTRFIFHPIKIEDIANYKPDDWYELMKCTESVGVSGILATSYLPTNYSREASTIDFDLHGYFSEDNPLNYKLFSKYYSKVPSNPLSQLEMKVYFSQAGAQEIDLDKYCPNGCLLQIELKQKHRWEFSQGQSLF